jgi:hypothetical protein
MVRENPRTSCQIQHFVDSGDHRGWDDANAVRISRAYQLPAKAGPSHRNAPFPCAEAVRLEGVSGKAVMTHAETKWTLDDILVA